MNHTGGIQDEGIGVTSRVGWGLKNWVIGAENAHIEGEHAAVPRPGVFVGVEGHQVGRPRLRSVHIRAAAVQILKLCVMNSRFKRMVQMHSLKHKSTLLLAGIRHSFVGACCLALCYSLKQSGLKLRLAGTSKSTVDVESFGSGRRRVLGPNWQNCTRC